MTPTVSAAIVAAVATTVVSVLTVVVGRYLEHRSVVAAEIRKSKIPVYTELVASFMAIFSQGEEEGTSDNQGVNIVEVMKRLNPTAAHLGR